MIDLVAALTQPLAAGRVVRCLPCVLRSEAGHRGSRVSGHSRRLSQQRDVRASGRPSDLRGQRPSRHTRRSPDDVDALLVEERASRTEGRDDVLLVPVGERGESEGSQQRARGRSRRRVCATYQRVAASSFESIGRSKLDVRPVETRPLRRGIRRAEGGRKARSIRRGQRLQSQTKTGTDKRADARHVEADVDALALELAREVGEVVVTGGLADAVAAEIAGLRKVAARRGETEEVS